ncbi:hypothetical protein BH11PSE11_BH11PSE11_28010 [soil metagenome]
MVSFATICRLEPGRQNDRPADRCSSPRERMKGGHFIAKESTRGKPQDALGDCLIHHVDRPL